MPAPSPGPALSCGHASMHPPFTMNRFYRVRCSHRRLCKQPRTCAYLCSIFGSYIYTQLHSPRRPSEHILNPNWMPAFLWALDKARLRARALTKRGSGFHKACLAGKWGGGLSLHFPDLRFSAPSWVYTHNRQKRRHCHSLNHAKP